jgi:hypothetical protein|tara:strand:- start:764 stop:1483 length:720 start_codon:yes stop_codon:yes gene_type:complete
MKIIYRISDAGYNKVKPDYIDNEKCLANAVKVFKDADWLVIADNVSAETNDMIQKYVSRSDILYASVGHGAGTFNLALDELKEMDTPENQSKGLWEDEIIYFIENDYLHKPESPKIIEEGFSLGAAFVSLYDHPDKYIDPAHGGNPECEGGGEETRVYLTDSCHWKITNSTTMTFATTYGAFRRVEPILRKWTSETHPHDYNMFLELRDKGHLLVTSIPGYSTHGETAWLTPLTDWSKV